jgi:hypothetical protein
MLNAMQIALIGFGAKQKNLGEIRGNIGAYIAVSALHSYVKWLSGITFSLRLVVH